MGKGKEINAAISCLQFLEIARGREVTFTPAAEVIIQQYYQTSRRIRSSDMSGSSVPVSTLPTLYVYIILSRAF